MILIQVINMNILRQKIDKTTKKKTEEENDRNGIKNSWPKGTCIVIGDSTVGGINEPKMSSKRLIKERSVPCATSSDIYHYLVKNPTM